MTGAQKQVELIFERGLPEAVLSGDRFKFGAPPSRLGYLLAAELEKLISERDIYQKDSKGNLILKAEYRDTALGSKYLSSLDYGTCVPAEVNMDGTLDETRHYRYNTSVLVDEDWMDYLPILIPMTKDMEIDDLFSEACPDMTETVGGCFRFEDEAGQVKWYGMPDWATWSTKGPDYRVVPHLEQKVYKSIRLVEWEKDLPCKPIHWVSFGGMLFAQTPIFTGLISDMKSYGLLQV